MSAGDGVIGDILRRLDTLEQTPAPSGESYTPNYLTVDAQGRVNPLIQYGGAAGGDLGGTYPNPTVLAVDPSFSCPARIYLSADTATAATNAPNTVPCDTVDFDPVGAVVVSSGAFAYQALADGHYAFRGASQIAGLGSLQAYHYMSVFLQSTPAVEISRGERTWNFSADPDIVIGLDLGLVVSDMAFLHAGDIISPSVYIQYATTFRGGSALSYFSAHRVA